MPLQDIARTQDETCPGGLCLVGSEPVSNFIIWEKWAQARDPTTWNALMGPALAPRKGRLMQSTSDEAPGLLAYVEHPLGAHHSPDLFHVQHELSKAVASPLAPKVRAAPKDAIEAPERRVTTHAHLQPPGHEAPARGPGRSAKEPLSLEQAQQAFEAARRAHERLAHHRAQVAQSIRAIGQAYSFVALERGVRRNGQLIASDIRTQIDQVRAIAQHEGLSQSCLDRIEKAQRGVPKCKRPLSSSRVMCGSRSVNWT